MKRVFVSFVAIVAVICMQLCGTKAMATNIDEATARQLGTYYLSVMTGNKMPNSEEVTLAYTFMNEDLNIPAAYVFNVEKQGFVIVSGSDLWYPILGYSSEGLLDVTKMAPSFKWYFEGLCGYIIYSQNTNKSIISDIKEEWEELYNQTLPVENPKAAHWLMDNEWGQGDSYEPTYNKMCPFLTVGGVKRTAYVGCVATAMSQLMHFWKYPVEPVDDYIGYTCYVDDTYFGYIDIDLRDVSYDYEMMPIKLNYYSADAQIDATALLCYHAGVSVHMGYGLEGSGTQSSKVPNAMRDVFLYDSTMEYLARTHGFNGVSEVPNYTNDEWVEFLSTEIEAGRPMYYDGYSAEGSGRDAGGHAFVCDGKHPSNGKFHFNWGWDGQPNVWSDVRNNDMSAGTYNFKFAQGVIINLKPRQEDPDPNGIENIEVTLRPAYPNPATMEVTIPYELNSDNASVMSVYSIDGKLMERVDLNASDHQVKINVSDYPNGVYVYRVGASAQKFVVK